MIIEDEIPRLGDWFWSALGVWVVVLLVLMLAGILVSVLFSILSRGPRPGLRSVGQRLKEGTYDLMTTSPRRVYALSLLAVQEAIRRKVFYLAFGLYFLVLLGAAWFLDPASGTEPARLYLDDILTWTTWLVLAISVLLAVFSLPGDIVSHTITTVVTKPVRPTEIVLGRIFGFTAVGSILLLVMGLVNYLFVTRSLAHQHEINGANLVRGILDTGDEGDRVVFVGATTSTQGHVHPFQIDIVKGAGETEVTNQHWHAIHQVDAEKSGSIKLCEAFQAAAQGEDKAEPDADQLRQRIRVVTTEPHGLRDGDLIRISDVRGTTEANSAWVVDNAEGSSLTLKQSDFRNPYVDGGQWTAIRYEVGGAQDLMKARVPVHAAKLVLLNRRGEVQEGGINIGYEWDYRGYVEGGPGSLSRAILTFRDFDAGMFQQAAESDAFALEMTLSVFRTHKSDIVSPIGGSIEIVNPNPKLLFRVRLGPENELNAGRVSESLRQEFQVHDHPLPERVLVSIVEAGREWQLDAESRPYVARKTAGALNIYDPNTRIRSDKIPFETTEFSALKMQIPKVLPGKILGTDETRENATLFRDYVANGVEVDGQIWNGVLQMEITCAEQDTAQFLGVAKHDVYFVADQAAPAFNFLKGHLSIWLQMVLVISLGVMFSTFLNGFVALLATAAVTVGGFLLDFMFKVINPEEAGGAAFESLYRVLHRQAMTTDLAPGVTTNVILFLDSGVRPFVWAVVQALPNMTLLSSTDYVSQGFNIPWNNLAIQFLTVLGFVIPLCLLGHYILKGRELAK